MTDRIELTDEERAIVIATNGWEAATRELRSYVASRVSAAKAETREQVAQEIEALDGFDLSNGGLVQKHAARIARGATQ